MDALVAVGKRWPGLGKVGAERGQQARRRGAAHSKARGAVEKSAWVDQAAQVLIEPARHLGVEVGGGLAAVWRRGVVSVAAG